jgi:AraC-like DNA-binding protein
MLFYTVEGAGDFTCADGTRFQAGAGSLVLIDRGTPQDYASAPEAEPWCHWWVHFLPEEHWAEWLAWPRMAPGHHLLAHLPADLRPELAREFTLVASASRQRDSPASLRLGINALERVFLLCANRPELHLTTAGRDPRVRKARAFIAEHLGGRLALPEIAAAAGLSRSRLSALFEAETGQSVMNYVEELRLQRARELLERSNLGLAQIADSTGFANEYYFSTRFKRHFRQAPGAYRKALWKLT